MLKWNQKYILPEVGKHIIILFANDLGDWYAAGIAVETTDTHEIVFADVLSGTLYDWQKIVLQWAYL